MIESAPALTDMLAQVQGLRPGTLADTMPTSGHPIQPAEPPRSAILAARAEVSLATIVKLGPIWLRQGLLNLPTLARWPSIADLRNAFAGRPAMLVSPGPSLDKNITALRDLQDKAVIIAYSRAVGACFGARITPHLTMALDPLDLAYHFQGLPIGRIGALVFGVTCSPATLALPWARVVHYSGNDLIERWMRSVLSDDSPCELETSSSVATTAVSLAIWLGCRPVVLLGQDLAFTEDRLYADSTPDAGARLNPNGQNRDGSWSVVGLGHDCLALEARDQAMVSRVDRLHDVQAWDGQSMVRTTPNWLLVIEWMQKRATEHPGRFIDATEGGARLDGMEYIPLSAVVERLSSVPPLDPRAVLDKVCHGVDLAGRQKRALDLLLEFRRRVETMQVIARAQKRLAARLPAGGSPSQSWIRRWRGLDDCMAATMLGWEIPFTLVDQENSSQVETAIRDAGDWLRIVACSIRLGETVQRLAAASLPACNDSIRRLDQDMLR